MEERELIAISYSLLMFPYTPQWEDATALHSLGFWNGSTLEQYVMETYVGVKTLIL